MEVESQFKWNCNGSGIAMEDGSGNGRTKGKNVSDLANTQHMHCI